MTYPGGLVGTFCLLVMICWLASLVGGCARQSRIPPTATAPSYCRAPDPWEPCTAIKPYWKKKRW